MLSFGESVELPYLIFVMMIQLSIILAIIAVFYYIRSGRGKVRIRDLEQEKEIRDKEELESDERIKLLETRITNLEKFRDKYFQLKERYELLILAEEELENKIRSELSEEDQAKLKVNLDKLSEERNHLRQELLEIEKALEGLLDAEQLSHVKQSTLSKDEVDGSVEKIDVSITTIKNVVEIQKSLISDLNDKLASLSLEAKERAELEDTFDKLDAQYAEMGDAIDILQEENEFLQDQIQALLAQGRESDVDTTSEITKLKVELAEKINDYDELYNKFTQIESGYLKLEEEHAKGE